MGYIMKSILQVSPMVVDFLDDAGLVAAADQTTKQAQNVLRELPRNIIRIIITFYKCIAYIRRCEQMDYFVCISYHNQLKSPVSIMC